MEPNTNTKSNLPAIAFAVAALVAVIPSAGFARGEAPTETVPYGDLNLASQDGIDTLDRRLDRAVRSVCGTATARELHKSKQVAECREQALAAIQPQRSHAIARATGQQDGNTAWAENAPQGQPVVSLSE